MTVAFLGPTGTYSEQAAAMFAGEDADLLACAGMPAVIRAVESGKAFAGVLPVENAIEGPVSVSLDMLIHETNLRLRAEVVVLIQHVLVAHPGATLQGIRTVMSHPQALAQCRAFLERELPQAEQVASLSTGGAVEEVSKCSDPTIAAIGPERSQRMYGGEVIARDIMDVRSNMTRFMALAADDAEPTGDDKTFIAFKTDKDEPGSLFRMLEPFARAGLQLTNIITRPTKGWLGEYVFLIEFLGHRKDPAVADVLREAEEMAQWLKVIGSCPRFPIEDYADLVTG